LVQKELSGMQKILCRKKPSQARHLPGQKDKLSPAEPINRKGS
jgi:hypothetical protein